MRLALASAAVIWLAAILLSPFAIRSTHATVAVGAGCIYAAGSFVCHQRPERSFFIAGRQMPVCARCVGLYASAAVASILLLNVLPMTAARARWIAFAAALPTIGTWLVEHLGGIPLSNGTRFVAALPLGAAVMWLLLSVFEDRGSRIEVRVPATPRSGSRPRSG